MKIKVKLHGDSRPLQIVKKGEWIDLRATNNQTIKPNDYGLISLGISMKLPDGFEAVVVPRSSTFKQFGLIMTNSIGVIDNSYSGTYDVWHFPYVSAKSVEINSGDRICQFRIQLSQKATVWQKLKWLFSNGIKIQYVEQLEDNNRGGFGSTGK